MIWFLLQKIGFYIFLIFTIYFVINRKFTQLLVLYFWGMTFACCYQFAVTIWFPTKIIAMAMVMCVLFMSGKHRNTPVKNLVTPLLAIFFFTLLISDIIAFVVPAQYATHINKATRIFNTNYTYITTILLLLYGTILPKGFVKKIYPHYCLAVEVAIAFGLLHFFCLMAGIDFMPILRQDGSMNEVAKFSAGGQIMLRIYGVSGEPKSLAFLILPYLVVSLAMYSQGIYRYKSPKYHLFALLAGIFVLVNTYSSAALINFAIAVPLILWFLPIKGLLQKLLPIGIFGILVIGIWSSWKQIDHIPQPNEKPEMSYAELLYDRSFGRAQEEMEDDRQERVILDHLLGDPDPFSRILGYGTSQYTFQVPGQTIGGALIPVQSGLVLTLCDFGIMGLAIYIMMLSLIIKTISKSYRYRKPYGLAFSIAALSSIIGSLMFGSIVTCIIYMMLALYGFYDFSENKSIKNHTL